MPDPVTLFGMTYVQHLESATAWLDEHRQRLHTADCSVHEPSAKCSCGLHRCMTDIRAVLSHMDEMKT